MSEARGNRGRVGKAALCAVLAACVVLAGCHKRVRIGADKANCMSNLRQIGIAWMEYLDTIGNHRFLPPDLKTLLDEGVVTEPRIFVCPSDDGVTVAGWYCSYDSIFEMTDTKLTDRMPSDLPIAWDKECFHGDGRCVLFKDGHVEFVREEDFPKVLDAAKKHVEEVEKKARDAEE